MALLGPNTAIAAVVNNMKYKLCSLALAQPSIAVIFNGDRIKNAVPICEDTISTRRVTSMWTVTKKKKKDRFLCT